MRHTFMQFWSGVDKDGSSAKRLCHAVVQLMQRGLMDNDALHAMGIVPTCSAWVNKWSQEVYVDSILPDSTKLGHAERAKQAERVGRKRRLSSFMMVFGFAQSHLQFGLMSYCQTRLPDLWCNHQN